MGLAFQTPHVTVYQGDVLDQLRALPDASVDCCVTSPPYWGLRDYGVAGQIGLEKTPDEYVAKMVEVFREVRRVLADHGTLWLNLGDSYAAARGSGASSVGPKQATNVGANLGRLVVPLGLKPKDMVGIPWMVAFALRADGWYLRSDIIWAKSNPMPESVTDRPTKSHEYVFLLSKSERYFYDAEAIKEDFAASSIARISQPTFGQQTGCTKDHGPTSNRSARKALENLHARVIVPADDAGPELPWNAPGKNSRENADRDPAHLKSGGKQARFPGVGPQHAAARNRGEDYEAGMAINPTGRNARTVWTIATQPYPEAHFATFPRELPERCIKAGCPEAGVVLDPFAGSGTTIAVARDLGRKSIGIELNPEYVRLIEKRCAQQALDLVVGE